MKDTEALISTGVEAVRTVLNRPKNLVKGPFPEEIEELYGLALGEINELEDEIFIGSHNLEAIKYEAADACAYLFALIAACDKALEAKDAEP